MNEFAINEAFEKLWQGTAYGKSHDAKLINKYQDDTANTSNAISNSANIMPPPSSKPLNRLSYKPITPATTPTNGSDHQHHHQQQQQQQQQHLSQLVPPPPQTVYVINQVNLTNWYILRSLSPNHQVQIIVCGYEVNYSSQSPKLLRFFVLHRVSDNVLIGNRDDEIFKIQLIGMLVQKECRGFPDSVDEFFISGFPALWEFILSKADDDNAIESLLREKRSNTAVSNPLQLNSYPKSLSTPEDMEDVKPIISPRKSSASSQDKHVNKKWLNALLEKEKEKRRRRDKEKIKEEERAREEDRARAKEKAKAKEKEETRRREIEETWEKEKEEVKEKEREEAKEKEKEKARKRIEKEKAKEEKERRRAKKREKEEKRSAEALERQTLEEKQKQKPNEEKQMRKLNEDKSMRQERIGLLFEKSKKSEDKLQEDVDKRADKERRRRTLHDVLSNDRVPLASQSRRSLLPAKLNDNADDETKQTLSKREAAKTRKSEPTKRIDSERKARRSDLKDEAKQNSKVQDPKQAESFEQIPADLMASQHQIQSVHPDKANNNSSHHDKKSLKRRKRRTDDSDNLFALKRKRTTEDLQLNEDEEYQRKLKEYEKKVELAWTEEENRREKEYEAERQRYLETERKKAEEERREKEFEAERQRKLEVEKQKVEERERENELKAARRKYLNERKMYLDIESEKWRVEEIKRVQQIQADIQRAQENDALTKEEQREIQDVYIKKEIERNLQLRTERVKESMARWLWGQGANKRRAHHNNYFRGILNGMTKSSTRMVLPSKTFAHAPGQTMARHEETAEGMRRVSWKQVFKPAQYKYQLDKQTNGEQEVYEENGEHSEHVDDERVDEAIEHHSNGHEISLTLIGADAGAQAEGSEREVRVERLDSAEDVQVEQDDAVEEHVELNQQSHKSQKSHKSRKSRASHKSQQLEEGQYDKQDEDDQSHKKKTLDSIVISESEEDSKDGKSGADANLLAFSSDDPLEESTNSRNDEGFRAQSRAEKWANYPRRSARHAKRS
ncbi:hypothetical protein E3P92_00903 [Wallemia ichthyophaga]|nr:hypothetical protein E3P95_00856 [Wallemia ichthyophaga]TIB03546.1 hypothetical protein E3P94_00988 [Wallemia ichthyophaga]TIB17920.1 hypothetical protein E3P92_00903 [Wallemia ichthyophaga]